MNQNTRLFYEHVAQTSPEPIGIEVERGEGIYLYGPLGERYIDFVSGICVSNLGHSVPEVVAAIKAEAERFLHPMVYGEFVMASQVAYATRLTEMLDDGLDSVYFTNSGAEAIEGALKLAKKYTGRQEIVAFHNSYHGSTHAALSITGNEKMKAGYGPFLPGVTFLPYDDIDALGRISEQTACVVVEPVQGAGGMIVPQPDFLPALRRRCDETGALLILDEIQTGFGRTGHLFAHQGMGFVPDVLVLAKALGAGLPLGAFIAPQAMMQVLKQNPILGHITTFGGNPVCCAAGLAMLDKLLAGDYLRRIPAKERLLRERLRHPAIVELRGKGLMYALIMEDFPTVERVHKEALKRGLVTIFFLNTDKGLRLTPPLSITEAEMEMSVDILLEAIEAAVS